MIASPTPPYTARGRLHTPRAPALHPVRQALVALLAGSVAAGAQAASFNITGATTSAQSLSTGQTGTIAAGASLTVAGSSVAVTITGHNASLSNLGTLAQTGSGRAIRDNTGVTGLVISNGSAANSLASMVTADADVIQMNKATGSVSFTNWGVLTSTNASAGGNQVIDFNALTDAGSANSFVNQASGVVTAYEADALRMGLNGVVRNWGSIQALTSTGASSDAIDMQSRSGLDLYNAGSISGGRHGITGGQASASDSFAMVVVNDVAGSILGLNGSGINIDGVNALQTFTLSNAGTISGRGVSGDGDGVDVDGVVDITNLSSGVIRSTNAYGSAATGLAYSEGLSVGGGSIVNAGTIEGLVAAGNTNAVGRGISLVGNDITSGPDAGQREALYANASVTNQAGGVIRGQSDAALYAGGLAGSGRTLSITNQAGGRIQGGGTGSAAILVAADYATTVRNAGQIDGSSSGKAIQLGAGADTVRIEGGAASVQGSIDGGSGAANTLQLAPGAGNTFGYAGTLSNFATVTVESGTTRLSGVSDYTGSTHVLEGATLVLEGAHRLAAASALALEGGTLVVEGASAQVGQSFASLSLSGSSDILLNGSRLSFASLGSIATGAELHITGAHANDYALSFAGNVSGSSDFNTLMAGLSINGMAARYSFDGVSTTISAVPEPDTLAMLLAGLGLLGATVRRRQAPRA